MGIKDEQVISFFQDAISEVAYQADPREAWGKNISDNSVMAIEIQNVMEQNEDKLRFIKKKFGEQSFEIEATIGTSIITWQDLREAIYFVIGAIAEQFLMVQMIIDSTSLQYWLATGTFSGIAVHGHIGIITIRKEEVEHLNPELFAK